MRVCKWLKWLDFGLIKVYTACFFSYEAEH